MSKVVIIGKPNVGKSSLINLLAKRKAAGVQNKPGYTRGEQWIRVNKEVFAYYLFPYDNAVIEV